MKRLIAMIVSLVLLTGALVGCAKAPVENINTGADIPEENQPIQESDEESTWPRTIKDAAGHDVVFEKKPERVAILHSMYLEYFFGLETPPVASAGANIGNAMKALEEFATLKPYNGTAEIIDLGSARELNLEAILNSDPDVIVTFNGHGGVDKIYDQLVAIAPVVLLDYTASWQDSIRDCAEIVGQEKAAEQLIEKTENMIADAREKLSSHEDKTVIFVRSDGTGGIFALGFDRYPYYYDKTEGFGLSKPENYPGEWGVISLESLAEMDPDYIIFQDFIDDAKAAVDAQQASVWQNLKAVKNGHVFYFDVSLNTTSPLALQILAESLVEAMSE